MDRHVYDCAVIGSGIAGSTAAKALSRCGLSVLVLEGRRHPRFAIGESLVPTASLGFRHIADQYDIPELRMVMHYAGLRATGCGGYPKQGFWFGVHREGRPLDTAHQCLLMTVAPEAGGPDTHLLRSDVDAFLAERLDRYGVEYVDECPVEGIAIRTDHVRIRCSREREFRSRFLIDGSGPASPVSHQLGLRCPDPGVETWSRAYFSHFECVPPLEGVLDPTDQPVACRDACTMHHCFDGGWLWVIRFDTGVTSVGLMVDRRVHTTGASPKDEFWSIVDRFPTMAECLRGARMIRPMVATGRVQYRNRTCFGARVAVMPHGAAFIDPLYSSGLNLTQAFIRRLVPNVVRAVRDGTDLGARQAMDAAFRSEVDTLDRIVALSYRSFHDFDLFKQVWRAWLYVTAIQYVCAASEVDDGDARVAPLYGADIPEVRNLLSRMDDVLSRVPSAKAADLLASMWDTVEQPFGWHRSNWAAGSGQPCFVRSRGMDLHPWFTRLRESNEGLARRTDSARFAAHHRLSHREYREAIHAAKTGESGGGEPLLAWDFIDATRNMAGWRKSARPGELLLYPGGSPRKA